MTPKSLRREAAAERARAAMALARAELLERTADELERLPSSNGYATVTRMESNVTEAQKSHPGPQNAPKGPLKELGDACGLVSLREIADALGVPYGTVRQWNRRGSIPDGASRKVAALRSKSSK